MKLRKLKEGSWKNRNHTLHTRSFDTLDTRIQNLGLPLHYIKEILIMLQFSSNWTIFVKL